jgi:hypothetical protein
MGFEDPILGGDTLIRNAIQSRDYVAGSSGWAIKADGTAEFNDVIVNGGGGTGKITIDGDTFTVYDSAGNKICVINGDGLVIGPDLRNGTQSSLTLDPANPEIAFKLADNSGTSYNIAGILTSSLGNPSLNAYLEAFSPSRNGFFDPQTFLKLTSGITGTVNSSLDLTTQQINYNGSRAWLLTALQNNDCSSNLTLGGASAPIPGCAQGFGSALLPGTKFSVTMTVDSSIGTTSVTNIGEMWVSTNGGAFAKLTGDINHATGVNTRASCTRTWSGIFVAGGSIGFEPRGRFVGTGGTNAFFSPHTTVQYSIWQ